MKTKKLQNTTALRVKFLANTRRLKITQTNNNKYCYILSLSDVIQQIENILNNIKEVESFSLIVDNTQKDYFLFNITTKGNSFPDIINIIKSK